MQKEFSIIVTIPSGRNVVAAFEEAIKKLREMNDEPDLEAQGGSYPDDFAVDEQATIMNNVLFIRIS